MHPDILRQLAAEHTRDLITEAGEARRAREARSTQRRWLAAHLRWSTRLAAQHPPVENAAEGQQDRQHAAAPTPPAGLTCRSENTLRVRSFHPPTDSDQTSTVPPGSWAASPTAHERQASQPALTATWTHRGNQADGIALDTASARLNPE
jgi:hypothetical protein